MVLPAEFDLRSIDGLNGLIFKGTRTFGGFGHSVSNAGDVNGDGFDDIIIGSYIVRYADPIVDSDSYVIFGRSSGVLPLYLYDGSTNYSLTVFLDGSTGFRLSGGGFSGSTVSGAGDVNGDGFDDLIVGSSSDSPNGISSAGVSYVVFGQSSGFAPNLNLPDLDGSNGFVINGFDEYDYSGRSVSSAGDVNGDGFDDLIIGASSADPNDTYNAGESYVVFGRSSGFGSSLNLSSLDGSNGFVINGIDEDDYSGRSVSSAGDVNGDGFDDLIIGASGADPNDKNRSGESYVVFGRSGFDSSLDLADLNGSNGFVLNGIDAYDSSGWSVSSAGDINGDGIDDLIIGAPFASPIDKDRSGVSYVVFGRRSGFGSSLDLSNLNGRNGFVLNGIDRFDRSGFSVSSAGDVNGDGFNDIIIGAPRRSGEYYGLVGESYVVFGRSSGFGSSLNLSSLDGRNGFALKGNDNRDFDESGYSVSGAGDFNGDGFDDLIIGAPFAAERNYASRDGWTYIVYGQESRPLQTDRILGTSADDLLTGDRFNNPIFGLAGDDTLRGGQGDDQLIGGGGNDLIVGGAGGDRLTGGNGFDSLRGGAGEDEFVFENVSHKADRILDFNVTEDVILISKSGFDLDIAKGGLSNGRFTIGSGASDRGDRFIYNDQTGALIFDADGSGAERGRAIAFFNQGLDINAVNIRIV